MKMTETLTQSDRSPPNYPPSIATAFPDEIEELGNRIAALTQKQRNELADYINEQISPIGM